MSSPVVNRRAVLKGLGATIALPWLESMNVFASPALAQTAGSASAAAAAAQPPLRFATIFMPNGVNTKHWDASGSGRDMVLSSTLSPLEKHKQDIMVLKGLWNRNSKGGDGHYAKTANILSGEVVHKTKGRDLRVGTSMDQLIAQRYAGQHPLSSLVLATEPTRGGVDTQVGFTQLYGGHISWSSATTPVPKEIYPRQAFDRLFHDRTAQQTDKSILDAVLEDAKKLQAGASHADRLKLDEYFESIRSVEQRIAAVENAGKQQWTPDVKADPDDHSRPAAGLPNDPTEHIRLMLDMIVLAFQMNKTRVATFMFGNSVSSRNMSFLDGVRGSHHDMSHHENNDEKLQQYELISRYHVGHVAYIMDRMKSIGEGDATLMDNTMLLFTSDLSDGNSHNPRDLPVFLAGRAGGTLDTGRAIDCSGDNNKMCALHMALLERMGVEVERFGDADKALEGLGTLT